MRISVSGINGSGKTSLARSIQELLIKQGFAVYLVNLSPKAFSQTTLSQIIDVSDWRISSIFFNTASVFSGDPGHARSHFTAAYVDYVMALEEVIYYHREIKSIDDNNSFIIHDRHTLDRKANALTAGSPMDEIEKILNLIPKPELTLLLDIPVEMAQYRIQTARGRVGPEESYEEELIQRQSYLQLAERDFSVRLIDASMPEVVVLEQAILYIIDAFPIPSVNIQQLRMKAGKK